jgi:hypothetical protein
MLVPASGVWFALGRLPESKSGSVARLALAGVVGAAAFVALQVRFKAPEIQLLRAAVAGFAPRRMAVAE